MLGLALLLAVLIGLTQVASLDVLSWILGRMTIYLAVAVVVIFQPEIRRALAELGKHPFALSSEVQSTIENIVEAVTSLSQRKIGALIAVERNIGTRAIQETGVKLDAKVTTELLVNIFSPHTPLHDGGVIISGDRIVAAGCVFPLSEETDLNKSLGTRHRAALGMSEETDAAAVVVSEETGSISTCYRDKLDHGLSSEQLKAFLSGILVQEKASMNVWHRFRRRLDLTPEGIAKSEKLKDMERVRAE